MSKAIAFEQAMAEMTAAERYGYDAIWLAEIHFQKDRSVLASPLAIAAALAGRTGGRRRPPCWTCARSSVTRRYRCG